MKLLIIIAAISIIPSICLCENICPLKGTWKSNKDASLEEMKKADLTEKQIKFFSGDLFGKMIVEATCGEITFTFDEYVTKEKYKVIESGINYMVIESIEEGSDIKQITRIELNGNCYLIPVQNVGFNEVFCRVKK